MSNLPINNPRRLITFGCSFTGYTWPSWPEILAYELNVPLYNFGLVGAGNMYICNAISQFDRYTGFDENDLVIISWTTYFRNDQYIPEKNKWEFNGNIANSNLPEYVKEYYSLSNCILQQLPYMYMTTNHLKTKCNLLQISMQDMKYFPINFERHIIKKIYTLYKSYLNEIMPSFQYVLWNNDTAKKVNDGKIKFGANFCETHPTPKEHLTYLEHTLQKQFQPYVHNHIDYVEREIKSILKSDIEKYGPNKIVAGSKLKTDTSYLFPVTNHAFGYFKNSNLLL